MRICVLLLVVMAGCGDESQVMMMNDLSSFTPDLSMDMAVEDLTFVSSCGTPGDPGNAKGVGKFCSVQGDCLQGTICTHAFSADDYFCTIPCSSRGAADQCGTGAGCTCSTGGCGCVPAACLPTPQE